MRSVSGTLSSCSSSVSASEPKRDRRAANFSLRALQGQTEHHDDDAQAQAERHSPCHRQLPPVHLERTGQPGSGDLDLMVDDAAHHDCAGGQKQHGQSQYHLPFLG